MKKISFVFCLLAIMAIFFTPNTVKLFASTQPPDPVGEYLQVASTQPPDPAEIQFQA